jgi:hypothetical protein
MERFAYINQTVRALTLTVAAFFVPELIREHPG